MKGKAPQLLLLAMVVIVIAIILLDALEDTVIEGGSFTGTRIAMIFDVIVTLTNTVTSTIRSWNYAGIFLLMLLESSSLPIPSEVILPFSGFLISQGDINLWITILVSTLAGVIGSLVDYYIGLKGASLLAKRKILDRLLFSKARLETAERWFNRYGSLAVFLSRMIPGFRTLVSFPAGAVKMSLLRFVAYTTAGCLVWNSFLIYLGVYLGNNWRQAAGVSRYLILGALAVIILILVGLWIRRRKITKHRQLP